MSDVTTTLTYEESDAIGELSNILVGTAACCLGNSLDLDVDITIPEIRIGRVYDLVNQDAKNIFECKMAENDFYCYSLAYTDDSYEDFLNLVNYQSLNKNFEELMLEVVSSVNSQFELLMDTKIKIENVSDSDNENIELGQFVIIKFGMTIDSSAMNLDDLYDSDNTEIVFALAFPINVSKSIANKLLNEGVAVSGDL